MSSQMRRARSAKLAAPALAKIVPVSATIRGPESPSRAVRACSTAFCPRPVIISLQAWTTRSTRSSGTVSTHDPWRMNFSMLSAAASG